MVETVKRKRVRSFVLLAILLALAAIAAALWLFYYHNKIYFSEATAYVDGRIETDDSGTQPILEKLAAATPSQVVADRPEGTGVGLMLIGASEEDTVNAQVLKLLEEKKIQASFALSASEALEDEDRLASILASGGELISNGLTGQSNVHTLDTETQVRLMASSRETLSTAANTRVPLLYCESTLLTGQVLRCAAACGYSAMVSPSQAHVLDINSFASREDAAAFVASLSGQSVIAVDLRGRKDSIEYVYAVVAQKPAIDKQPDIEAETTPAPEPVPLATQLEWLLDALDAAGIKPQTVGSLQKTDGLTYLRTQAQAADAVLTPVLPYCLTAQQTVGVGILGLPENAGTVQTYLAENPGALTLFLTPEEAGSFSSDQYPGVTVGGAVSASVLNGKTSGEIFDWLYNADLHLRQTGTYEPVFLLEGDLDADVLHSLRAAAQVLNISLISPKASQALQAGALCLAKENTLSQVAQGAKEAGLALTDLAGLVRSPGQIAAPSDNALSRLEKENKDQAVEAQNLVYTTDRQTAFLFYGVENAAAARDAGDILQRRHGQGTFCVTLNELMNCGETVEALLSQGHSLAVLYGKGTGYGQTFREVSAYLSAWDAYARWRYGVTSKLVFMTETPQEETLQALSAGGYSLIQSTYLIVKSEDREISPEQVPEALERIQNLRVMRGSFVCFNMNYYTADQSAQAGTTVLGALLKGFLEAHIDTLAYRSQETGEIEDGSRFRLVSAEAMLSSPNQFRALETPQTDITLDKNVLTNLGSDEERFDWMQKRYYGNVDIRVASKLPGFTGMEIPRLDTKGTLTQDKVLFLTFDDWGTEQSVNPLLYVLEKHGVKVTFFIRTNYVDRDPNLLRAIAVQGHQIASHTDQHLPLSDTMEGNESVAVSLTEEEAQTLRQDLVTAYDRLYRWTGDVTVDGKPALSRMFRPPTLAVSKIGLYQVFDVGYSYSISGDFSTSDYKAESYEKMLDELHFQSMGGGKYYTIHPGSVVVMHMQENSRYTAQALDAMIPIWQAQGYSFARIDDYLKE